MAETRRDRVRAATMREITETARQILVEQGTEAVTLRAIAREMGMTAPALYRYFGSHQELLRHLIGDIFIELTEDLHTAIMKVPAADMSGKFMAAARGFRHWALTHEREYGYVFGTPFPRFDVTDEDFAAECGRRLGMTFLTLFLELWHKKPFAVPTDEEIPPILRDQLARYREGLGADLPLGTLLAFLRCWLRLQGSVSLEAFGHLDFALDDPSPMFELMVAEVMPTLGLEYAPPRKD